MEGSIIFYTYGSTLELNGQQFEAGRLTEDLLNLSPDDYHPLHERMVRIRTLMDIYEYHMMKESAVEKAKERAVTKLKKAYPGSRLQIWRNVHRMIRRPILPAKDDRALRRSFTTSTLRNQESGRS